MSELIDIKIDLLKRGLTQRQLALHLGVSDSYISDILRSIRPVGNEIIQEIRRAIGELSTTTSHSEDSDL